MSCGDNLNEPTSTAALAAPPTHPPILFSEGVYATTGVFGKATQEGSIHLVLCVDTFTPFRVQRRWNIWQEQPSVLEPAIGGWSNIPSHPADGFFLESPSDPPAERFVPCPEVGVVLVSVRLEAALSKCGFTIPWALSWHGEFKDGKCAVDSVVQAVGFPYVLSLQSRKQVHVPKTQPFPVLGAVPGQVSR